MHNAHAHAVTNFFTDNTYLSRNQHTIALRRLIAQELLPDLRDTRVLDIGCGDGSISLACALQASAITLIDISPSMIERARQQWRHHAHVTAIHGDFLTYTPQGPFDVVFMFGVLAHVPDLDASIEKVAQLLRPNGRALIQFTDTDCCMGRLCYYTETIINRHGYQYPLQKIRYSDVRASSNRHHLQIEEQRRYSLLIPGMGRLPKRLLWKYQLWSLRNPRLSAHGTEVVLLLRKQ
ncbi:class I SAM-dependent methyltransferase [Candidatus Uhrbacteria bacterium]|nr:class I SAM-dependent methyltransferase [Candidatus Uhrbacteria bacterium]